jgi:hypothetical protein
MNAIFILLAIIAFFVIVCSGIFLLFTRQGKNLLVQWTKNKKYVVCHIKSASTDFVEIWKVVPAADYLTQIGKYDYDLNPKYAVLVWKGRLHYTLNENDVIPAYLSRLDSKAEILIQVQEVRTALHNKAYDFLYMKNKNIALILCGVGLVIAILVAIYGIYEIQRVAPLIQWLYDHPPQAAPTQIAPS